MRNAFLFKIPFWRSRHLRLAALHNLWPLPLCSRHWPESERRLDDIQKWVNEKRQWIGTFTDVRIRRAYIEWVNYVQMKLNESREENRTHATRLAFNKRWLKKQEDDRKIKELANRLPKP